MSLTLLYKKVEVLKNEVMGLIPTPVQIYQTIEHQTAQLQSSLSSVEHQITILYRRYSESLNLTYPLMQIVDMVYLNLTTWFRAWY